MKIYSIKVCLRIVLLGFFLFTSLVTAANFNITSEMILKVESEIPLPPDPGQNGKTTIEGVDVDGNGIRDDIQRYLEIRYYGSPRLKSVYLDYAKYLFQYIYIPNPSIESLMPGIIEGSKVTRCLSWLSSEKKITKDRIEKRELMVRVFNTPDRKRTFNNANSKLVGMPYVGEDIDKYYLNCDKYGFSP